ncbi:hypothetical protein BDV10DRAFT_167771 [Aspergillus recurvatus]
MVNVDCCYCHGRDREGTLPRKTLAEIEDSSQLGSRYLPVRIVRPRSLSSQQ